MANEFLNRLLGRKGPAPARPDRPTYANYQPGETIAGKFKVERVLEGGLGRVFVVTTAADPPFILKTVQPGLGDISTFMQEARGWVRLGRHPNIVPAFWADTVGGMPCVAAEFVPPDDIGRTTLRDHLQFGLIPLHRVVIWAAQFCYAMQHAADRGMIAHRDIKPENLLIDRYHSLQITDFGLAASRSLEWPRVDEKQFAGGTPLYMAPEQWRGEKQDFRTDAYAFGLALFEVVFGRLPWKCSTFRDLREAHLTANWTIPKHPLGPLISAATATDPANRLSSPSAMLALVRMCADLVDCPVPPPPSVPADQRHLELYAQTFLSATRNEEHALAAAEELTARYDFFVPGWIQLGKLHYQAGRIRDAGLATQEALDRDKFNSPALNNMGLILARLGHAGEAEKLFLRAIDCDAANTGAMTNLSGLLVDCGRSAEAMEWVQRAAKISPDKVSVWLALGSLYANAGNNQSAQHAFERALDCVSPTSRRMLDAEIRNIFSEFKRGEHL